MKLSANVARPQPPDLLIYPRSPAGVWLLGEQDGGQPWGGRPPLGLREGQGCHQVGMRIGLKLQIKRTVF